MIKSIRPMLIIILCLTLLPFRPAEASPAASKSPLCSVAANGITHLLDGETGQIIRSGNIYLLPVEQICKILGISFLYDAPNKSFTLTRDAITLEYKLQKPHYDFIDGRLMGTGDFLLDFNLDYEYIQSSELTRQKGYPGDILYISEISQILSPEASDIETSLPKAVFQHKIAYTKTAGITDQIITITKQTDSRLSFYEKNDIGLWRKKYTIPCHIGKNGISYQKKEGDKYTPGGNFSLSSSFGIENNPGSLLPYTKINSNLYWVDDPKSNYYNQLVNRSKVKKDWKSAEHLSSMGAAYHYAMVIDSNPDCIPYQGSAIFLHCTVAPYTSGCISVGKTQMLSLLQTIKKDARIVIAKNNADAMRLLE